MSPVKSSQRGQGTIHLLPTTFCGADECGQGAHAIRPGPANTLLSKGIFGIILFIASVVAQTSTFSSSGYAAGSAEYLNLPVTARAAALCGAATAWREDLTGIQYNPALYDALPAGDYFVDGTYSVMTLDRKHIGIDVAATMGNFLVGGLSFVAAGVDNIDGRDSVGDSTGMFSYDENAIAASVAGRFLWNLSLGATIRYLFEKMETTGANGVSADLGISWQPLDFLCIAASAQNLGGTLWWTTGHSDQVLTTVRVGISSVFFRHSLRAELDLLKPLKQPEQIAFGAQYSLFDIVFFRGGISSDADASSMHASSPDYALGVGLRYSFFGFDYGLSIPNSDLGLTHKITVNLELKNPFK